RLPRVAGDQPLLQRDGDRAPGGGADPEGGRMSAGLSKRQEASLERIGDIMAPKGEGFPAFSETGCVAHVDRVLAATPADDVTGLRILLAVLSFFPRGLLLWFLNLVQRDDRAPGFLAPAFRNIHLGLK